MTPPTTTPTWKQNAPDEWVLVEDGKPLAKAWRAGSLWYWSLYSGRGGGKRNSLNEATKAVAKILAK